MSGSNAVVLYHGGCIDGFSAAWSSWCSLGDEHATYRPVFYGDQPPPDILAGSDIYIVDFSYPRDQLLSLADRVSSVLVLDHHKTAREDLEGWDHGRANLAITFDMDKSGAVLAWEHFHPKLPVPRLLLYVQDRDIWKFKLPASREINACIKLIPFDFGRWSVASFDLSDDAGVVGWARDGKVILDALAVDVERLVSRAYLAEVGGHLVPVVNAPIHQSEVGEALCKEYPWAPFAACWSVTARDGKPDKVVWSLRSRGGFDVSAVARALGGGGHAAAAGYARAYGGPVPAWVTVSGPA